MFLILLVIALLLAIPTFGVSLLVFVVFYGYKTTSMKQQLVQTLKSLPDVTHQSEGYVVDIKYEQVLAFAEEIGNIKTYRSVNRPDYIGGNFFESEYMIKIYKINHYISDRIVSIKRQINN